MRDAFFVSLYETVARDERVVVLTSDTGALVLDALRRDLPQRCINVGIAEENMIGVAAGLAMSGKIVYTYAIVPFVTMRCYEQVRVDVCCQNLPVKMIGVGAGMDYSILGPTHHGTEDIAMMRQLPGMTVLSPSDNRTAATFAFMAYETPGPVYVRLDRTGEPLIHTNTVEDLSAGASVLSTGTDLCIIATGRMVATALDAAKLLSEQSISVGVVDLYRIKPLNAELLSDVINGSKNVITLEEHFITGGIGSAIAELIAERGLNCRFKRVGMPDQFVREYGSREYLRATIGLSVDNITNRLASWVGALAEQVSR